jgi:hypothetical protein
MDELKPDVEICDGCGREFPIDELFEGYCVECEMDYEDQEKNEEDNKDKN